MLNRQIQKAEAEYRAMLTRQEYSRLLNMLRAESAAVTDRINYYYDTPQEELRSKSITCLVRQTGKQFIGIVRQHLKESGTSMEKRFSVHRLPPYILTDKKQLLLCGQLRTHRTVIPIGNGIRLMLDCNSYLGKTDYNLELEYHSACNEEARGMMRLLLCMLNRTEGLRSAAESDRFFRRLHQLRPPQGNNRKSPEKTVKPSEVSHQNSSLASRFIRNRPKT